MNAPDIVEKAEIAIAGAFLERTKKKVLRRLSSKSQRRASESSVAKV